MYHVTAAGSHSMPFSSSRSTGSPKPTSRSAAAGRTLCGVDPIDPIERAKGRYADVLAAAHELGAPELAAEPLERARQDRESDGDAGRVGFAVLDFYRKGDGRNYRVLVSDGRQHGVILARLRQSVLSSLAAQQADDNDYLVRQLQQVAAALPADEHRWLSLVSKEEPLTF
jgi:hypothetical protein